MTYRPQAGLTSSDVSFLAVNAVLLCFTYTVALGKGQAAAELRAKSCRGYPRLTVLCISPLWNYSISRLETDLLLTDTVTSFTQLLKIPIFSSNSVNHF